jgi:hypothetical protein
MEQQQQTRVLVSRRGATCNQTEQVCYHPLEAAWHTDKKTQSSRSQWSHTKHAAQLASAGRYTPWLTVGPDINQRRTTRYLLAILQHGQSSCCAQLSASGKW